MSALFQLSSRRAFGTFPNKILHTWLADVEPFIQDGRLLYLPQRFEMYFRGFRPDGRPHWVIETEKNSGFHSTTRIIRDAEACGASALLTPTQENHHMASMIETLECAMPFIDNIPLTTLHKVLGDEDDALVRFRAAISSVIPTYISAASQTSNPEVLRRQGIAIRRDVLEPEIAKLNTSFNRIVQTRAMRVLGATVPTIGLGLAALSTGGLPGLVAGVLGAGGVGAIANEYADYKNDILSLSDNPFYFAWMLKRRSQG